MHWHKQFLFNGYFIYLKGRKDKAFDRHLDNWLLKMLQQEKEILKK